MCAMHLRYADAYEIFSSQLYGEHAIRNQDESFSCAKITGHFSEGLYQLISLMYQSEVLTYPKYDGCIFSLDGIST